MVVVKLMDATESRKWQITLQRWVRCNNLNCLMTTVQKQLYTRSQVALPERWASQRTQTQKRTQQMSNTNPKSHPPNWKSRSNFQVQRQMSKKYFQKQEATSACASLPSRGWAAGPGMATLTQGCWMSPTRLPQGRSLQRHRAPLPSHPEIQTYRCVLGGSEPPWAKLPPAEATDPLHPT